MEILLRMKVIHYHGTPAGGPVVDRIRFLRGRHVLIPFPSPEDLPLAADVSQSFVFDNGAFSIWKQGGTLDVDGYIRWVETWHRHPAFDCALIPDVIDGTETENDEMIDNWPGELQCVGVPVFHLHEELDRLKFLASQWPRVALGSSGQWPNPGTESWWQRMGELMRQGRATSLQTARPANAGPRHHCHMGPMGIQGIDADPWEACKMLYEATRFFGDIVIKPDENVSIG